MVEYHIGQKVRFRGGAHVSERAMREGGVVEGYDEVDEVDYVIVKVPASEGFRSFTQYVLPHELRSETKENVG